VHHFAYFTCKKETDKDDLELEQSVFRIFKFLCLPDPDPLVRCTDPDPSITQN
jgi:hypothetical protein